jgi:heme A synthase
MDVEEIRASRALRGWSVFTVAWALLLLFAGANVTTTRSGDAIPSWPQPWLPRDFSTPALIEWSHRGVAAWMGFFTLVLAVWAQYGTAPRTARRVAWSALVLVVVQAAVGGLRVRMVSDGLDASPVWLKVVHAVTGQLYFCALVAVATLLAPRRERQPRGLTAEAMSVMRGASLAVLLLLVQLVLGALGRHGVLPREVHALFALPVLAVIARLVLVGCWDVPAELTEIRRRAGLLGALAGIQLGLGLASYFVTLAGPDPAAREVGQVVLLNLHLAGGAALLGTALSLLVCAVRVWGAPTDERIAPGVAVGSAS